MKTYIENVEWTLYDNRYIKPKIKACCDKINTIFSGLNVSEDGAECESFTFFSVDSLLAYENKYYLKVYLNNCAYKIVNKQMINYLDNNLFESDEN